MLYSDHEALEYINSQKTLNCRNGKWVSFLHKYYFIIKHKAGFENKAANDLSLVVYILPSMEVHVVGFDLLTRDYPSCKDFNCIYADLLVGQQGEHPDFFVSDGYLFEGT